MSRRPALRRAAIAAIAVTLVAPARASPAGPERTAEADRRPIPLPILRRAAPPADARLVYFGGRVLGNVEVVMVLWGEGTYEPYVTGEGPGTLPGFFEAVSGGPYLTGLAEYDTGPGAASGGPGTGQHIGPGRYAGQLRIAPSTAADAVDDAAVAAELAAQLTRRALPAPRADAAGRLETLYLVYFPRGKRITLDTGESCRSFCAYHGAFDWGGRAVAYAVMPDISAGSGCDLGCGSADPFSNAAAVASHELAEAVTDPDVGPGSAVGPPLAWVDPVNGEIGDLCADQVATVAGPDGAPWPVQKLWSNRQGACAVPSAPAAAAPLVASAAPDSPAAPGSTVAPALAPESPATALPLADAGAPRRAAALSVEPASAAAGLGPAAPTPSTLAVLATLPRSLPAEPLPLPLPLGNGVAFAIEEENDALSGLRHPTDETYTQGARISARWALHDDDPHRLRELGVAVGQNLYTPSDLKTTDLDVLRHDRPYAAWLYASFLGRGVDAPPFALRLGADGPDSGERVTELEVAAGVMGAPAGGFEVQSAAHSLLRQLTGDPGSPPPPAGWSVYQVAARPTFDASFRHQFDLVQASALLGGALTAQSGSVLGLRLAPRVRLDVGTTFGAVGAGLELRAGLLSARAVNRAPRRSELYGYVRADGRWVAYNALIQGPLRDGVTSLVSLQPWVGDLGFGAVLRLGAFELGYGQLRRTSEIRPLPAGERRVHAVGQLSLAWAPR